MEVSHLQKLQHAHIIQLVGIYAWKREVALLLYPAADYSFAEFLDETTNQLEDASEQVSADYVDRLEFVASSLACLSSAMRQVHGCRMLHGDIKANNILVRRTPKGRDLWTLYLTDFSISCIFPTGVEEEDDPTAYTRRYAAPEVVLLEA